MQSRRLSLLTLLSVPVLGLSAAVHSHAQPAVPTVPRTIFIDSDGKEITNNEFVDIRLANPHYKDQTQMRSLEDGGVEFRLQKVPQEGMTAPVFSVRDLAGENVMASAFRGKVVVLNFWFIGCAACRAEMPHLNRLKEKVAGDDRVEFIAMTADPASSVKNFLERNEFTYRQVADAQQALDSFAFSGYPRNIVISKTGEIVYWRTTVKAWYKFESVLRDELAK
ncbi:MAG TPA: TlpA disulfide reductase family protein [Pyrinomonadaceae bacterium]|nr:TlpA disulfide reductase family protein [Pyrinomonadaceae bacterium]